MKHLQWRDAAWLPPHGMCVLLHALAAHLCDLLHVCVIQAAQLAASAHIPEEHLALATRAQHMLVPIEAVERVPLRRQAAGQAAGGSSGRIERPAAHGSRSFSESSPPCACSRTSVSAALS